MGVARAPDEPAADSRKGVVRMCAVPVGEVGSPQVLVAAELSVPVGGCG
ncbi:hypothetical protein [Streptomyces sp. NPDC002785]